MYSLGVSLVSCSRRRHGLIARRYFSFNDANIRKPLIDITLLFIINPKRQQQQQQILETIENGWKNVHHFFSIQVKVAAAAAAASASIINISLSYCCFCWKHSSSCFFFAVACAFAIAVKPETMFFPFLFRTKYYIEPCTGAVRWPCFIPV